MAAQYVLLFFYPSPVTPDYSLRTWEVLFPSLADSGDLDIGFSSMKCMESPPETLGNTSFLIRKGHRRKTSTALPTFAPGFEYSVLKSAASCHQDVTIKKTAGTPAQNSNVTKCCVVLVWLEIYYLFHFWNRVFLHPSHCPMSH